MIYVTIKRTNTRIRPIPNPQINILDILEGNLDPYNAPNITVPQNTIRTPYAHTLTFPLNTEDRAYRKLLNHYPIADMRTEIHELTLRHMTPELVNDPPEDMSEYYNTFFIPKKSGGYRRIDAPKPRLMQALRDVKDTFEKELFILPHNAAHAYTQGRSTVTAMQVHQAYANKWFLKLDLKDFFPAHNFEYIMETLKMIWPFSRLLCYPDTKRDIESLIKLGLLNDSLPQGTPLSPLLTNILMAPIDFQISTALKNSPQRQNFVYTRYADDLLISAPYHFDWRAIQSIIVDILEQAEAPFRLNTEKTRYGSSAGRNWNLGIMLNKDNKLTIGHKQNQRFRASVNNFLRDLTNNVPWSKLDVQVLVGEISYYKAIQPEYVEHVLATYSEKYHINFNQAVKEQLQ